jgi:hypothetical protein
MKFLVTWTWKVEDIEKCWKKYEKVREAESESYGEVLYPSHLLVGNNKGFMVVDITNMENFYKWVDNYSELLIFKTYPILPTNEMFKLRQ